MTGRPDAQAADRRRADSNAGFFSTGRGGTGEAGGGVRGCRERGGGAAPDRCGTELACKLAAGELEALHSGYADITDLDLTGYSTGIRDLAAVGAARWGCSALYSYRWRLG